MKTLEEINRESHLAVVRDDINRMVELADEYQTLGDPAAEVPELRLRGIIAAFRNERDAAIAYYERGIALAKDLGADRDAVETLCNLGHLYTRSGHTQDALQAYMEALSIAEEHGVEKGISLASGAVGMTLAARNEFDEALPFLKKSLEMDEQARDLNGIASGTGNLAILHARMGDFPEALKYFERSKAAYIDAGDESGAANIMGNLGTLYIDTAKFPEALASLREALDVMEAKKWRYAVASTRASIATAYMGLRDYQAAEPAFHAALEEIRHVNDRSGEAAITMNLGALYEQQGELGKARVQFQRAVEIQTELDDAESTARALANRGRMEVRCADLVAARSTAERLQSMRVATLQNQVNRDRFLAELAQAEGNLEQANSLLVGALSSLEGSQFRAERVDVLMQLRDLARSTGDFEGYIRYNDEMTALNEEIRGKETTVKVAMQEAEREIAAERQERERERAILYSTLPQHIADRIIRGEDVSGDHYERAAVLFLDIVGFTTHTSSMEPQETTRLLATIFDRFDEICREYDVTKVKTIGDSYMCFAHSESGDRRAESDQEHAANATERIAAVALAMRKSEFTWPTATANSNSVQFRIGIHSGPVVAGVIGRERLQYDVWGDTVNTASRMESTGEPGRIQVSERFARALCLVPSASSESDQAPGTWHQALVERGAVEIKGKGTMTTYWLEGG